jgi:TrmH family RNA methyltransferase
LSTIRNLHRRKGRDHRGLALAEGVRLVEEMLAAGVPCKGALISPTLGSTPRGEVLRNALASRGLELVEVSDQDLVQAAATEHPQGVVAVYQPQRWTLAELRPAPRHPFVILDGVQDPGNVGTIARTALAFGAAGLIALPGTVDLTNPKTVRAGMGALFRLPHLLADPLEVLPWLASHGVALWATTMDGAPLEPGAPEGAVALAFGNEGAGLSASLLEAAARRVGIPIASAAESLNVAVAAAILLHAVTR